MKFVWFCFASFWAIIVSHEITEEPWNVSECPTECSCSMKMSEKYHQRLRTVDCSDRNLLDFPSQVPVDVQNLILKNNKIRRLSVGTKRFNDLIRLDISENLIHSISFDYQYEQFDNLKSIDLSFNRLNRLNDLSFRNLLNLEDLNLSHNIIAAISDFAFVGLSKLESLSLTGNRLSFVQNVWWSHLKNLYELNLNRNRFTFIQSKSFEALQNLLSLDLSSNKIYRINDDAFAGLKKLESLSMESNFLIVVPREAIKCLISLKSVDFGKNAFFKIRTDDFANFSSLKDISLSNMQRLRLIERGAFKNLPELLVLEIHDNPYLGYLDKSAFVNSPQVTHLHLHNNNLTVFERATIDSLLSLEEVSFYGNPISCDCNARWLNQFLTEVNPNERQIVFREAERMVCDGPFEHKFKLFTTLRSSDLPRKCSPKILFMFDNENSRKLGDDITYDCRAVGVPEPRLTWVSPEGESFSASTYHARRTLMNTDTLVIRHIKSDDAGTYACIAENEMGNAVVQTHLNVSSMQIGLEIQIVSGSSVTVTWNGADRENNIFQLLFRPLEPNSRHQYAATVTPIMKSFTIKYLQPSTPYETCIAFEDDDNVLVHISCVQFTTKGFEGSRLFLERTSNVAIGAALGIVACVLIVVCLVAVLLKRKTERNLTQSNVENGQFYNNYSTDSLAFDNSIYAPLMGSKLVTHSDHMKQIVHV